MNNVSIKKKLFSVIAILMLVLYLLLTDPFSSTNLIKSIPYGIELIMISKIFLLSLTMMVLLSYGSTFLIDMTTGLKVSDLSKKAERTSTGAGRVILARALMSIAYAIIIFGVLIHTMPE